MLACRQRGAFRISSEFSFHLHAANWTSRLPARVAVNGGTGVGAHLALSGQIFLRITRSLNLGSVFLRHALPSHPSIADVFWLAAGGAVAKVWRESPVVICRSGASRPTAPGLSKRMAPKCLAARFT